MSFVLVKDRYVNEVSELIDSILNADSATPAFILSQAYFKCVGAYAESSN